MVLFLHGADGDRSAAFFSEFFDPIVSAGYAVLAFDYPGHGACAAGLERASTSYRFPVL